MHWGNALIALCFYIALPISYIMLRSSSFERNGLILSVTLPAFARTSSEVCALCQQFRCQLLRLFVALTLILLPVLFLPWISVVTTVCCIWLIVAIIAPLALYGHANTALRRIKRHHNWQGSGMGRTVVQLPPSKPVRHIRTIWFLPPALLSALPLLSALINPWPPAWRVTLIATAASCVLITVISLAIYPLVFRQRLDALDENIALTQALTRIRRYNWTKFWLLSTWCSAGYSIAVWCCQGNMTWYLIWTVLYSLILIAASLQTEFAARRAQMRLTKGCVPEPEVDEDAHWLWGLFYYNPNNRNLFVNERIGIGMSMNLARPAGKWMMGICVLLILSMPLFGILLMAEEFSPIQMDVTPQAVVVQQAFTTYQVPVDQIQQVRLFQELPAVSRISGTGLDNLLKGHFSLSGYGTAQLCLNPTQPPFLLLKTSDDVYLFGGPAVTELYANIQDTVSG